MHTHSFHFIPADRIHYLDKLVSEKHDTAVILDLEDSVSSDNKFQARANIKKFYQADHIPHFKTFVRVNEVGSDFYEEDVELLRQLEIKNIILPKVSSSKEITDLRSVLGYEIKLIILIESFQSFQNMERIVEGISDQVWAASLGIEDMLCGIPYLNENLGILITHIKQEFVCKTLSNDILPIDTISLEYKNTDLFEAECEKARQMGYSARLSIHPSQIPIINDVFTPKQEEQVWAKNIQRAVQGNNVGYGTIDGLVVSPPKVLKSGKILQYGHKTK